MKIDQVYDFELFADYFQFYLEDDGINPNTSAIWDREKTGQMLAVAPGLVAVGTARNMTVPIRVLIGKREPPIEVEKWDRINECSLRIDSGRIVVIGCTDYYPKAERLLVEPGVYRVSIQYGGLNTLSEDGLDGKIIMKSFCGRKQKKD